MKLPIHRSLVLLAICLPFICRGEAHAAEKEWHAGVAKVSYDGAKLTLTERGSDRTISIETGPLFPD